MLVQTLVSIRPIRWKLWYLIMMIGSMAVELKNLTLYSGALPERFLKGFGIKSGAQAGAKA